MSIINKSDKRMGKGLNALFNKPIAQKSGENENVIYEVKLTDIVPNPFQPRKIFNDDDINDLANSISVQGLIQPIVLRKKQDSKGYQIISGERRYRAFKKLDKEMIPAHIFSSLSDQSMMEISIIENVQREDLSPLEISYSYKRLLDECNLTQEQIAERVGKKRSSVANLLRLQNLPEIIKDTLRDKTITLGHAKIILGLEDDNHKEILNNLITKTDLSVRKAEEIAKKVEAGHFDDNVNKETNKSKKGSKNTLINQILITEQEEILSKKIDGKKVRIKVGKNEKGSISLKFNSVDEMKYIIEQLTANN